MDLTPRLTEALAQWQSARELAALTADTEPSPWMFPTSTGTLIEVVAIGKRFRLVLRKAGLPAFRLYDLRCVCSSSGGRRGGPASESECYVAVAGTTDEATAAGGRSCWLSPRHRALRV
jgi:hypothetical protein